MIGQYFDVIVLLVVVFIIYQKLKNILGTRPDGVENTKISDESAAKIFDIIMKEAEQEIKTEKEVAEKSDIEKLSPEEKTLLSIPNFDKKIFINGAKKAFEIIIEAFNKGDVETLEMLVSKDLLKKFQSVIEQRRADGVVSESDFISFDNAEIIKAKINKNKIAEITVKFITQQVNILKNAAGNIIEGDDQYIQNITDIWTFSKATTSSNPNWLLVSTKK